MDGSTNEFLNADGTVKAEYLTDEFDAAGGFQDIINKAIARGDTETANQARVARGKKVFGNYSKYGKYDNGDYALTGKNKTETAREFDDSMKYNYAVIGSEEKMNDANNATNYAISQLGTQQVLNEPTLTKAETLAAIKSGTITQKVIDAYNYHYGADATVDNPPDLSDDGKKTEGDDVTVFEIDDNVKTSLAYSSLDSDGRKFVDIIQTKAATSGNVLTKDEMIQCIALASDYGVGGKQLRNVLYSLGVSVDEATNLIANAEAKGVK